MQQVRRPNWEAHEVDSLSEGVVEHISVINASHSEPHTESKKTKSVA